MAIVNRFQRAGYFTDRGFGATRIDSQCQQIAVTAFCRFCQRGKGGLCRRFITAFFQRFQAVNLCRAHRRIIDFQHINRIFIFKFEFIDPDHSLSAAINGRLGARGSFLNAHFRNALLNRCRHATQFLDFLNMTERARRQIMRQFFNEIAAAPRVDDFGGVAFHLQHKLRVARDTRREIGRQGQCFVKTVCVQRLRMALC